MTAFGTDVRHIRNIAIIAHVDHGKTTLVDCMLKQTGVFRSNQVVQERVLDSNDQERERGITILAKNVSLDYDNFHINIIDTPGHADFGGEVERVLKMADACLLVIDAYEGPMPQTRFVLKKAFENKLKPIVVINKVDRPEARPLESLDEVFDLFVELDASDEQLDFTTVYASAREGWAAMSLDAPRKSIRPLLDAIINEVPPPSDDPNGPLQMLVSTLDYNDYVGKIAIGRVFSGKIRKGQNVAVIGRDGSARPGKIEYLYAFSGLERCEVAQVSAGDICAVAGIEEAGIGETIAESDNPKPLPIIAIDEPTIMMQFVINDSPFAGQEGKYVTSRKLRERLMYELQSNVALKVEETELKSEFRVSGRGILHLGVFIENMRREGYELAVGKPQVIYKEIDGKKCEPVELVSVDTPEICAGKVIELFGGRGGTVASMTQKGKMIHLDIRCPTRGLIGVRNRLLSLTRGEAVMHHVFYRYEPYKGAIPSRGTGVLVSGFQGPATPYALINLQDRGMFFVVPTEMVYEGQIVGVHRHANDIMVNACRKKELTNVRSATKEIDEKLNSARPLMLEEALEFIENDELVEVTPKSIRLRKRILNDAQRARAARIQEKEEKAASQ